MQLTLQSIRFFIYLKKESSVFSPVQLMLCLYVYISLLIPVSMKISPSKSMKQRTDNPGRMTFHWWNRNSV